MERDERDPPLRMTPDLNTGGFPAGLRGRVGRAVMEGPAIGDVVQALQVSVLVNAQEHTRRFSNV